MPEIDLAHTAPPRRTSRSPLTTHHTGAWDPGLGGLRAEPGEALSTVVHSCKVEGERCFGGTSSSAKVLRIRLKRQRSHMDHVKLASTKVPSPFLRPRLLQHRSRHLHFLQTSEKDIRKGAKESRRKEKHTYIPLESTHHTPPHPLWSSEKQDIHCTMLRRRRTESTPHPVHSSFGSPRCIDAERGVRLVPFQEVLVLAQGGLIPRETVASAATVRPTGTSQGRHASDARNIRNM